jgi:hypothetical protein
VQFAELPALVPLAVVTLLILILFAYKATFGAVIDWLVDHVPNPSINTVVFGTFHVFTWIIGPLKGFNSFVYHYLGVLIAADKAIWNAFVHWNAYAWQELSGAVADLGEGVERAFHRTTSVTLPKTVGQRISPLTGALAALALRVLTLEGEIGRRVAPITKVVTREIAPTINRITNVTRVVYRDVPAVAVKAVAVPRGAIIGLESDVSGLQRWVRRHADLVTAGALTGLLIAALARIGAGWIRCANVNRVGRQLCGMDRALLDALLAGTLILTSRVSLEAFARYMVTITEELSGEILDGFQETHNLKVGKFKGYSGTLG